jgi:polyisoprenoid-binding protein YceI
MATAQLTRTGHAAAPAGSWSIDPARAVVAFSGRASFLAPTITARFGDVAGALSFDEVRVAVDVTTMTTGNRAYDEVIAAVDPFDSARFPIAVYASTGVAWTPAGADIDGLLTLRGVTRPLALSASYHRNRRGDRMVVRAGGLVDRQAFGLRFDVPGIGKLVPRQLRLDIDVDLVRSSEPDRIG